jgi:hypothetical protein
VRATARFLGDLAVLAMPAALFLSWATYIAWEQRWI